MSARRSDWFQPERPHPIRHITGEPGALKGTPNLPKPDADCTSSGAPHIEPPLLQSSCAFASSSMNRAPRRLTSAILRPHVGRECALVVLSSCCTSRLRRDRAAPSSLIPPAADSSHPSPTNRRRSRVTVGASCVPVLRVHGMDNPQPHYRTLRLSPPAHRAGRGEAEAVGGAQPRRAGGRMSEIKEIKNK